MNNFYKFIIEKKKIEQNSKEKLYEKYFNYTLQLKDREKNTKLIEDIVDNNLIVGRKYYNNKNILSYEERFISDKIKVFLQISRNITLIFPPGVDTMNGIIGYRFYNDEPTKITKDTSYFTLVLKSGRKFEILEKSSSIKDANNDSFINKNLKCIDIMIKIIKQKFDDNIIYQFPHTKIEILGFIYSAMLEDFNNFELIEPFFPSPFDEDSKIEKIDESSVKEDLIYIEPILFNEHISIFLISYKNKTRINLLIDPSLYHVDIIQKDIAIFNYKMKFFFVHPDYKLQSGPCCSIWFIGQILTFLDNKMNPTLDPIDSIIDVINKINELMNLAPVIYPKKDNSIINDNKNDINISTNDNYFISHRLLFCSFLDFKGFFNIFGLINLDLVEYLSDIKIKIDNLRLDLYNLEINKNYYQLCQKIFDKNLDKYKRKYNRIMEDYESLIKFMVTNDDKTAKLNKKKELEDTINVIANDIKVSRNCNIYNDDRLRKIYLESNDILELLNN